MIREKEDLQLPNSKNDKKKIEKISDFHFKHRQLTENLPSGRHSKGWKKFGKFQATVADESTAKLRKSAQPTTFLT
jgi:hypothetical protein